MKLSRLILIAAAFPLAGITALAQQPTQQRPHKTLADGRLIFANELKVTMREAAARVRSLDAQGKSKRVSADSLKALHPDIASIKGGHTSSRRWLAGEAIPARVVRADGKIPRIARNFSVILRDGADVVAVRAALRKHADVERVDLKYLEQLDSIPDDTSYGQQWAPPITGLETAWDVPGRGPVRVAVIDSGLQLSHPEFAGRVVFRNGYADFENGEAPASGPMFDHGTHVAGIICATRNNVQGVAGYSNDIQLMVLNCAVWGWNAANNQFEWLTGNTDDALDDAVANGASVINCSFGFNEDIEDEVEGAYDAGVLVVHAAGNSAQSIAGHWESVSIALLTVSATMSDGATPPTDVFDASYSNFGPGIDLAAPGTAIWSTIPGGYGTKQGTSMAAPQVSGAAALMMTMNPNGMFNGFGVRDLLFRMAQDKGPPGYDNQYGLGCLRLKQSTYQACRDASAFVSGVSTKPQSGAYDTPWRTIQAGLDHIPDGGTLILNGGITYAATYNYPAITITKPCVLSAIPDRPVVIGAP